MPKKNTLFNKNRFRWMEEDRISFLRNLTEEESIKIFESLTSGETWLEFKRYFTPDNPVCLKLILKRRRDEVSG